MSTRPPEKLLLADGDAADRSAHAGDRTAREHAEQNLERYRLLSQNALDIVLFVGRDGRILEANEAAVRAYGFTREELLARTIFDLRAEDPRASVEAQMEAADQAGLRFEAVHRRKDGSTFPVEVTSRGADIAGERVLLSVLRDISARKQADANQVLMTEVLRVLNQGGHDLPSMIGEILHLIQQATGLDAVGLRLREGDDYPYYRQSGFSEDFVREENALCATRKDGSLARDEHGRVVLECTCGLVLSGRTDPSRPCFTTGGSFWTNVSSDLLALAPEDDPRTSPRNRCIHVGYQSVSLIPVRAGPEIIGLLQLNGRREGLFTPELIGFFENLAGNLGLALKREQAEHSLRESEARYRSLFENMLDGYAYCQMRYEDGAPQDFLYLKVNSAFERLTGLREVTGKWVREVIPGIREADPELFQTYGRVARSGQPERFETYLESLGRWFSVAVYSPAEDHFVAVFENITERKQAEEGLRESEARLHLAQEAALAGTWEWDLRTNRNIWSEEIWSLYGLDPHSREASYEAWRDSIHPEDRAGVERLVQEAAREGAELNAEWRVLRADGSARWLMSRGRPLRDELGQVVRYLGVVFDITDRKRAEQERERLLAEVARQAHLLDAISEHTEAHLVYLDRDFNFLQVNETYARSCRRPKEDFLGHNHFEFYPNEENEAIFRRVRDTGEPFSIKEKSFEFPDDPARGLTYWDWTLTPIKDAAGEVQALVFSLLDVTGQVRTREHLLAAERARAHLAETLNNEIAHRVKNNLAMISGLLQMQAIGHPDQETSTALREAVARVQTFAHIHEQMYSGHSEEVELLATLERITTTMRDVFAARGDVHFSVVGEPVLCPARMATNLAVIANELITNALKHGAPTNGGETHITVTLERSPDHLRLAVWNSGPPPPEDFDPSTQSGMGLRLVWEMVTDQYQGRFRLLPERGGTLAEVIIPESELT